MLGGHPASLDPLMVAAIICEKYGWTYSQYQDQPAWFLDTITAKMSIEARVQKARDRELERLNRNRGRGGQ